MTYEPPPECRKCNIDHSATLRCATRMVFVIWDRAHQDRGISGFATRNEAEQFIAWIVGHAESPRFIVIYGESMTLIPRKQVTRYQLKRRDEVDHNG